MTDEEADMAATLIAHAYRRGRRAAAKQRSELLAMLIAIVEGELILTRDEDRAEVTQLISKCSP